MSKRNIGKILLCMYSLLLISVLLLGRQADAAKKTETETETNASNINVYNEDALLYVTDYSVTNESIIPGKEFTLKMTLKNFSDKDTANDVMVIIDNPEGVVPEYGTVSVEYIDSIAPKASKSLKFGYTADNNIEVSELNFLVYTSWDEYHTNSPIRIAVGKEGDVVVEECTIPEKFTVGKTDYISALVENVSGGAVNNLVMAAICDDEEIASETIGTLPAGASKTQYISVTFDKEGQHSYDLVLRYTDEEGVNKEYSMGSGMLIVDAPDLIDNVNNGQTNTAGPQEADNNAGAGNIVIICTIGILMIAICCVVLILLYRRK